MPIETSEVTTRSGHKVLRAVFSGEVTVDEARRYHQRIIPGAEYDHCGHLVLGNVTGVSSDVKKVLGSVRPDPDNPVPVAMLFPSALTRMTANLVMRLSGNDNSEAFKTEDEALEWLDQRLAHYHARRVTPTKQSG
ncbi:MAG: hypothetical protein AB1730_12980 [Myxococcota bacterium]|jgi:hypothetical protein